MDVKRALIGLIYAGLGYLAEVHQISILSRELWIFFDIIAIGYLFNSYPKDDWIPEWVPIIIIGLIGFSIIGPPLFDLQYFHYAKMNMLIGGIILFTSLG